MGKKVPEPTESNAVEAVVVTTNWGEAVWVLSWAPHRPGLITTIATTAIAPIMKRRKTESWVNW